MSAYDHPDYNCTTIQAFKSLTRVNIRPPVSAAAPINPIPAHIQALALASAAAQTSSPSSPNPILLLLQFPNLKSYVTFLEWNSDREITEAAECLYSNVDNFE
ncbi:hypothetical protein EI94DRAFT_1799103 [Lactarius quietus]|nr:hypothetical protein EI94DRAFT_1799103 [Lactarius quietus]